MARVTLSLQLSFYTFRKSVPGICENEPLQDENSLRQIFPLPYMAAMRSPSSTTSLSAGWILQSQISFVVSVVDPKGWTAYCFEDNLHLDEDGYRSKPGSKDPSPSASFKHHYYPEALANGKLDSTRQVEPRRYFLEVFEIRIRQVQSEWQNLVQELEQVAKRYVPPLT